MSVPTHIYVSTYVAVLQDFFGSGMCRRFASAFTITGEKLIFSDYRHQNIEVWDLTQCKLIKQLFMPRGRNSLKYSNDGNFLATSSLSGVHLFDGNNGEYKFSISGNYNSQPTQYYYDIIEF